MIRIAIFASGEGTNAQSFIDYFGTVKNKKPYTASPQVENNIAVALIISDNPAAKVLVRAKQAFVPQVIVNGFKPSPENYNTQGREMYVDIHSEKFIQFLRTEADFIVLAGFLRLIPNSIIHSFEGRIVNIHPALLPKYGGKGMYGNRVHKAVIENKEKRSGITIHQVNEQYDKGEIIFQQECEVKKDDTPQSLAERIHDLERKNYPAVTEKLIKNLPAFAAAN